MKPAARPSLPEEPANVSAATGEPVPLLRTPTDGQDMARVLFPGDCVFEPVPPASPRLSFKGWALGVWLRRNKGFVKTTLAVPVGVTTTLTALDADTIQALAVVWGIALFTLATRFGFDAFDYFVSEQPK